MLQKKFIGRREELNLLNSEYNSGKGNFVPIYGRRRVGKSELILHFLQDKPHIYFLGKKVPAHILLKELLELAARQSRQPVLAFLAVNDWQKALEHIIAQWQIPDKIVLVFDEFQWLAESVPEILSVLQQLWDLNWQHSGRIMLILCGSFIGFMEKNILGRKSPLFGRRTAQIFLKPFNYLEAAEFHPGYSITDKAKTYFICGGIPLYLKAFSAQASCLKNIQHSFLNEYSPLFYEPEFLLREELREVEKYYAILMALANGYTTHKQIAAFSSLNPRALNYYLKNLISLHYLRKRYPVTAAPQKNKQVRYVVADPMLRFWFRFVFPNLSFLKSTGEGRTIIEKIKPQLDAYFGYCFENFCREALGNLYRREQIDTVYTVGEFWDKQCQIDVVGMREDNQIDIGECKWGRIGNHKKLFTEIKKKAAMFPNPQHATLQLRLFTQYPVDTAKYPGITCHTLEALYE